MLAQALPGSAGARAPARGRACGSCQSKNQRLYVYVARIPLSAPGGRTTSCAEALRVLRAWFVDAKNTRRYGRWTCFDSQGSALAGGQIQYCSSRKHERIADYDSALRQ